MSAAWTARARAFVSVGSNVQPEHHVRRAVSLLRARFGALRLSSVYRSRAVGFEGPDFLNLVAAFETLEAAPVLVKSLRAMEDRCGRDRSRGRFASRTLDLDLLLLGAQVGDASGVPLPHPEITGSAFVLRPLAELAGDERHPVLGVTFASLWREFDQAAQPLHAVELELTASDAA